MSLARVVKIWEYGTYHTEDTRWQNIPPLDFLVEYNGYICGYSNFSETFEFFENQNLAHLYSTKFNLKLSGLCANNDNIIAITEKALFVFDFSFNIIYSIPNKLEIVAITTHEAGFLLSDCSGKTYFFFDRKISLREIYPIDPSSRVCSISNCNKSEIVVLTSSKTNKIFIYHAGVLLTCMGGEYDSVRAELPIHYPLSSCILNGRIYIANTNKNSILVYEIASKNISTHGFYIKDGKKYYFSRPNFIMASLSKRLIISDSKNCNLLMINEDFLVESSLNCRHLIERRFNLPRAIKCFDDGRLFVVDSHNNRILGISYDTIGVLSESLLTKIDWPRDITKISGNLYSCLTSVDSCLRDFFSETYKLEPALKPSISIDSSLKDAHQFVFIDDKNWILVDTGNNRLIVRIKGVTSEINTVNGTKFLDPHSADFLDDSDVIIADTGNSRLLISSNNMAVWTEIHTYTLEWQSRFFYEPRYVKYYNSNYLIIDTGSKSVYCLDQDFRTLWLYGDRNSLTADDLKTAWRTSALHDPRHVEPIGENRFIISDTGNSRLVAIEVKT